MTNEDDNDNIGWSRTIFAALKDGGVWAVPRSGLIFRKEGTGLVLQAKLSGPWPEAYQDDDYECIKRNFADAGIPIRKE